MSKALTYPLTNISGVNGVTILGDGSSILIIDVVAIAKHFQNFDVKQVQ